MGFEGRGTMRLVALGSRYFLAAVFLYAGADKAFHYGGFVNALRGYVLLPRAAASYVALPIILCEIFVGVSLLVRPWRSRAAVLAAGLLASFTLALAVNQQLAPGTLCGCWFTLTLGRSTPL